VIFFPIFTEYIYKMGNTVLRRALVAVRLHHAHG